MTRMARTLIVEPEFALYIGCWVTLTLAAMILVAIRFRSYALGSPAYWSSRRVRWRVITFAIATLAFVLIAPYTGDPTWDAVDAAAMAILTYLTAPWALGILYRSVRRRALTSETFVAAVVWMFSASWIYDGYILLRDGVYPPTWWSNIAASSVLYAAGGCMWSLSWAPDRGTHLEFTAPEWPQASVGRSNRFSKVAWAVLPFVALVALICGSFLLRQ